MQKLFASSLVVASLVFGQEPSAFNAGGTAPQRTESQIFNEKLFNLSTQVRNLEESQEGLKSVFEGQLQRVQDIASRIELLKGENNATITGIKEHVDSNFALQNENIEKIKQSISALGALIKKTNTQMQGEIDSLREKVAELESAQVATTNNVESKKEINNTAGNVAETIKDVQGSKIDDGIEQSVLNEVESAFVSTPINSSINTTVSASESLSVGALIASVESNATQIKMPSYDAEELKPLNAQSIESLPVDKEINKVGEKKDIQANINKKIEDSKGIEKVEPKVLENIESKNNITKTPEIKDLKKIPLASVFKEGEQFYKDKNYQKADEYLQVAVKGNYKPARGNYLLGEVAFEQKRYEDAIYYYKTSATRYDKADYMPRLMLHSAKSFEALKEKDNAKRFLETLIALYPTSSEAKEAKNLLNKNRRK